MCLNMFAKIFLSCKLVSPLNVIIFSETKYLILQIVQSEK